ncbi:MAG: GNAT family N-acetyltransferase [Candidatus Edwardsbacteria bacterium]|nr:GNAT family N-acetyltransferase [Candidatus Edwardsbacteria bacterium]
MTTQNETPVTLREITKETCRSILRLEVAEGQRKFVAANAVSIAEAHFSEHAWFRAIYAGETPVGFVMLALEPEYATYTLWRLMIDRNHQGKGYARRAMGLVIEHVKRQYCASELTLSYVPGEGDPSAFYRKLGFVETGEWDDDERVMKLVF